ncbi:MAG: hypothetical protein VX252_12325 [Myxococcota bacterium]|nr:hypothetical protein [Myxococcota bacterium]
MRGELEDSSPHRKTDKPEAEQQCRCRQCDEQISMGEGLRHSVISALAEVMPERALRAHTRHRDGRSLDQYASGARPNYAAMVARLSPSFPRVFFSGECAGPSWPSTRCWVRDTPDCA